MKLVIELNDNDIKRAVEQQVAAEVSKITAHAISENVQRIVDIKMGRIDSAIASHVEAAAAKHIRDQFGGFGGRSALEKVISDAAKALIKQS